MGYQPRSEPDSLNATVRDRRGLLGNVAYGGNRISYRITERAAMVTLHLWDARAQVLPDGNECLSRCTVTVRKPGSAQ